MSSPQPIAEHRTQPRRQPRPLPHPRKPGFRTLMTPDAQGTHARNELGTSETLARGRCRPRSRQRAASLFAWRCRRLRLRSRRGRGSCPPSPETRRCLGSVGDAYDNAMAESFFASLEAELLDRCRFKTQSEAEVAVFAWIEGWYNTNRRHSGIGYHSPAEYERRYHQHNALRRGRLPTGSRGRVRDRRRPRPPVDNRFRP